MVTDLFKELQQLMIKERFLPSKNFSQNFMVNQEIIDLIVFHAKLKKTDVVLEIGPGVGFLTQVLVKKCKVVAVEADQKMSEILSNRIKNSNLSLIEGDFLKLDLPEFNKVVSLPPYSISSPLMHRLLLLGFDSAYLVFQKEFTEKLVAEPGFYEYGAISVITQYYCKPKILIEQVKSSYFYPKPKSISSLVELKYKKRFGEVRNEELFVKFISTIFRYKKKNLRNAVINSYNLLQKDLKSTKEKFASKVDSLELAGEKVNLIEVEEFVEIFNELF